METKDIRLTLPAPLVDWLQRECSELGRSVHVIAGLALSTWLGALDAATGHDATPPSQRLLYFDDGAHLVKDVWGENRRDAVEGLRSFAAHVRQYADWLEGGDDGEA